MTTPTDPTPEGAIPAPEGAVPPPPAGYQAPPPGYAAPPPGYQAPPPGYAAAPVAPMTDADQRMWAMLAHLGGIILGFVAPLIIWLVYRERSRFVEEQAKESLNFQITILIGWIVSWVLAFILIGFALMALLIIAVIVFCIIGGLAANKGEAYRYPFAIRLVK
jgi:uncharacterized Tic20 family protein